MGVTSERMQREYASAAVDRRRSIPHRVKSALIRDYRTRASVDAFKGLFTQGGPVLSVGGGPERPDERLVNLNIGAFPNVDVVGDAHSLPCPPRAVKAVYCEAVLEHLPDPAQAVREMFRVLTPGGQLLAITPFLQGYHGYPHHYQNYTQDGHALLLTTAGFEVEERGACVGPVYTMVSLTASFIHQYVPMGRVLVKGWSLIGIVLRPLDRILNTRPDAHMLASTTYVLARRPVTAPSA